MPSSLLSLMRCEIVQPDNGTTNIPSHANQSMEYFVRSKDEHSRTHIDNKYKYSGHNIFVWAELFNLKNKYRECLSTVDQELHVCLSHALHVCLSSETCILMIIYTTLKKVLWCLEFIRVKCAATENRLRNTGVVSIGADRTEKAFSLGLNTIRSTDLQLEPKF